MLYIVLNNLIEQIEIERKKKQFNAKRLNTLIKTIPFKIKPSFLFENIILFVCERCFKTQSILMLNNQKVENECYVSPLWELNFKKEANDIYEIEKVISKNSTSNYYLVKWKQFGYSYEYKKSIEYELMSLSFPKNIKRDLIP